MKYFLLMLLLSASIFAADDPPEPLPPFVYPGFVVKATGTCSSGMNWNYQCTELWVPSESLVPTDIVAICLNPIGATLSSCANTTNPTNRRWRTVSALTVTDPLLTCSALPANATSLAACVAPLVFSYVRQIDPPPVEPPLITCLNNPVCFSNVTPQAFDKAVAVQFHMYAALPDLNGDGCRDAFNGSHSDTYINAVYIQQLTVGNSCSGNFLHLPNDVSHYTQTTPIPPRITSRNQFINWTGRADGIWSFWGGDSDGGPASGYPLMSLDAGKPIYDSKISLCLGEHCIPINHNGQLGLVSTAIRDTSAATLVNLDQSVITGRPQLVFDANGDSRQDIVHPLSMGYRSYNPAVSTYEWQADKFPAVVLSPDCSTGHMTAIDFDNDADLDVWAGCATYSTVGSDTVKDVAHGPSVFNLALFRNDAGVFTDITTTAGVGGAGFIKNVHYYTAYAGSFPADINNDGWKDIVVCGEENNYLAGVQSTIAIVMNNGDGTFHVDRSINFGGTTNATNQSGRPWCSGGDYDNDGKVDIVKTAGNSSPTHESIALWRNMAINTNHWLEIRVQGEGTMTDGLGASVTVFKAGTTEVQCYEQIAIFNSSTNNLIPHCGLGQTALVDVRWQMPNGGPSYTKSGLAVDRSIILRANGDIVSNYLPGTNPILAIADGVEPPPIDPEDPPPPTYAELAALIEVVRADLATAEAELVQTEAVLATVRTELDAVRGERDELAATLAALLLEMEVLIQNAQD